jgi:hypothetical protein
MECDASVSKSQYIRSIVCGFPARIRKNRCIVVLNGFVDDSGSGRGHRSGQVFVLAGFISTAERWEEFSDAFEALCNEDPKITDFHMFEAYRPIGVREYRFKDDNERDQRISRMVNLIKEKALYRVDSVLTWPDYEHIVKGKVPPELDSPYFLLYYNTILSFAEFMDRANLEGKVDWVFDEQGKIGLDALAWYNFISTNVEDRVKNRLGGTPVFKDDNQFLALKSADIFAWQVRRHLATEQRLGMSPNDNLNSLTSIYGSSSLIGPDEMRDFVWHSQMGMGLMLKAKTLFFMPKQE